MGLFLLPGGRAGERDFFCFIPFFAAWNGKLFFGARGLIPHVSAKFYFGCFLGAFWPGVFVVFWGCFAFVLFGVIFVFLRVSATKKCFFGAGMIKTGKFRSAGRSILARKL